MFFAVGGGVSVYEGILHLVHAEPLRDPTPAYIVLAVAAVFDGSSLVIGLRSMHRTAPGRSVLEVVRCGKDPSIFTVVVEDIADVVGIALAFLGVWLGHLLNNPYLDGAASIAVGLVLAVVSIVLADQSRRLLVGERAPESVLEAVDAAAKNSPTLLRIHRPLSMQLGPDQVLLALGVEFAPELTAAEVADVIGRFESAVRERQPQVSHIYVEAQSVGRREIAQNRRVR